MLIPKLVTTLRGYTRAEAASDVTAGLIVGIVALPLCIAFAIASGVGPERGLVTGVVAGFLISALGEIGEEHIFGSLDEALVAARAHVGLEPAAG